MRHLSTAAALAIGLSLAPAAWGQEAHDHARVGANVDDLIAIARRMNPDLQVSALEAEAAAARVEGAGSLADPKVQLVVMDWARNQPGYFPTNPAAGTTKKLYVTQALPFWGKRDLKREIAEAGARKAGILRRAVENDLVAKVKAAYAEYHSAHLTIDLARDLRGRMDTLARVAGARYAQALGRQQDVTRAEVEKSLLETEIARMEGERHKARVKINRLLGRDLQAPLVEAPAPRPIPPMETLDLAALDARAQAANPEILAQLATIDGSDKSVDLAEKGWYPDFEVGIGAVKFQGDWTGYEAMVTMNVPLQVGLRNSEIGEAKAMSAAARAKRESLAKDAGNALADSWIGLKTARQIETLLRDNQLPQAEIGFQAAAKGYELARAEFLDVLTAEQQLWKSNIDLIKVRFDQQMRLAEIEKLVGGDL
jgi:outer membrane protein TolC